MYLSKRPPVYTLPSYSLTGDLLGFLRCGLQYRYTRIGQLPSTRPVQAWFGSFIHGVLEEAYRRYRNGRKEGRNQLPPLAEATLTEICELIQRRLAAQGLFPWGQDLEDLGYRRARATVNDLGPLLFPLISQAEVRLTGARPLPIHQIPPQYRFREADRYEVTGVVDVITHIDLNNPTLLENRLIDLLLEQVYDSITDEFEIILDYKGMRRPPLQVESGQQSFWEIYGWQAQTYAHLRRVQEDSLPVIAGVIIYLNELLPTKGDLQLLQAEIQQNKTDVVPEGGSETERILKTWDKNNKKLPTLPLDFRLRRALRVLEVNENSIQHALDRFDDTVARIEICRGKELKAGQVTSTWEKNPTDESTCTACDAKTFCPSYRKEVRPKLPSH